MDMDGGDAVPYGELAGLARDEGLVALEVQVAQTPSEANGRSAVVVAIARTASLSFGAIGEASPRSAPPAWHPFLVTLAELRAKARALRELTGQEQAVQEELSTPYLPGANDEPPSPPPPRQRAFPPGPSPVAGAGMAAPTATSARSTPPSDALSRFMSRPGAADDSGDDGGDADDEDGEIEDDAGMDEPDEERPAPRPANALRPATDPPAGSPPTMDGTAAEQDYDSISSDTVAKLERLARSIAEIEGGSVSDAEVRQRLDNFFVRAFKHPLNQATRMEGQHALRRLSSEWSKRRAEAAPSDGGDGNGDE